MRKSVRDDDEPENPELKEEREYRKRIELLYPTPLSLEEIICDKGKPFALKDIITGIDRDMSDIS